MHWQQPQLTSWATPIQHPNISKANAAMCCKTAAERGTNPAADVPTDLMGSNRAWTQPGRHSSCQGLGAQQRSCTHDHSTAGLHKQQQHQRDEAGHPQAPNHADHAPAQTAQVGKRSHPQLIALYLQPYKGFGGVLNSPNGNTAQIKWMLDMSAMQVAMQSDAIETQSSLSATLLQLHNSKPKAAKISRDLQQKFTNISTSQ